MGRPFFWFQLPANLLSSPLDTAPTLAYIGSANAGLVRLPTCPKEDSTMKGCIRLYLLVALLCAHAVHGQTTSAQITGRISDPSDAIVSGAVIRVTNMDTGVSRETVSSSSGYYTVPLLDPGRYQVGVEMRGFQ